MRVLFIYKEGVSLGIGYLSSAIKRHGHDAALHMVHNTFSNMYVRIPRLEEVERRMDEPLATIDAYKPDIVAFSVNTADYQWALAQSRLIKAHVRTPIIFGGYHPTLLPERCIANPEVDMICLGEGEEAFTELLDSMQRGSSYRGIRNIWFKDGSGVVRNGLRPLNENLDALDFPDRDLFFRHFPAFWKKEIGFVLASRGCPFSCSYCGNAAFNEIYRGKGKILRLRAPEKVIEECLDLKRRYGIKTIHFQDDLFASNSAWLQRFIPEFRRRLGLPFTCLTHPKVMSRRTIELLKEGGCRLAIVGIQSGSERLRRDIFLRRETNEEIAAFARGCHEEKLAFSFNHIFDAPTDSPQDTLESARFYNRVRPHIIDSYCLVYFPKARILETAVTEHLLQPQDIEAIEEGTFEGMHQGGIYNVLGKLYHEYALLFALIPLLPRSCVERILSDAALLRAVKKIPLQLMPLVKTVLNIKNRSASFHFVAIRYNIYRFLKVLLCSFSGKNRQRESGA